jgi:hypothetical protein
MDARKLVLGTIAIFVLVSLSGCEEQGTTTEKTFENIDFESDIVELNAANMKFIKDEEEFAARSVELYYQLHNPLNRYVTVSVDVAFYDGNGREIYSEKGYTINLPDGYTEGGMNTISYSGSMVNAIKTAKISVVEVEE